MNKKHGVNIVLFVFIAISILTISCSNSVNSGTEKELIAADSAFSAMSEREGMHKAFLYYIADSGILMRDNNYPVEGRSELARVFSSGSDTALVLAWKPVYAKIGKGNDLGYTWGVWTRTLKSDSTVSRGTYLTIWELQPDRSWKFVLDVGTQGLPD